MLLYSTRVSLCDGTNSATQQLNANRTARRCFAALRPNAPRDKADELPSPRLRGDGQLVNRLFQGSSENERFGIGTGRHFSVSGTCCSFKGIMEPGDQMEPDGARRSQMEPDGAR